MKENEFIKGKWYKYTGSHLRDTFYAKYSHIQDVCDIFYHYELIKNGIYKNKHDWSALCVNPILLENIEEIQQFLPENHPDLIVKIPEKWYIKSNKDTERIIVDYLRDMDIADFNTHNYGKGWGFTNVSDKYNNLLHPNTQCPEELTEITFEFFKTHILKLKDMKKIIGYRCPTDLFQGDIPKETLYKALASVNNRSYAAINKEGICESSKFNLPKEIVEQWEPVYTEEFKTLTLGDKGIEVKISKNKIEANGGEIPLIYLTYLWDVMNNNAEVTLNWRETNTEVTTNIQFPFVKLGCTTFTKEEVKLVIVTYHDLNS